MQITAAQKWRLGEIVKDLESVGSRPQDKVIIEKFGEEAIGCANMFLRAIMAGMASKGKSVASAIIGDWHEGGITAVILNVKERKYG